MSHRGRNSKRSDRFRDAVTDASPTRGRTTRTRARASQSTHIEFPATAFIVEQQHVVHSIVRHEHDSTVYDVDTEQLIATNSHELIRTQPVKRQRLESEERDSDEEKDDEAADADEGDEEQRRDQV